MGDSFNSDKRGFFARRDEDAKKMDQGKDEGDGRAGSDPQPPTATAKESEDDKRVREEVEKENADRERKRHDTVNRFVNSSDIGQNADPSMSLGYKALVIFEAKTAADDKTREEDKITIRRDGTEEIVLDRKKIQALPKDLRQALIDEFNRHFKTEVRGDDGRLYQLGAKSQDPSVGRDPRLDNEYRKVNGTLLDAFIEDQKHASKGLDNRVTDNSPGQTEKPALGTKGGMRAETPEETNVGPFTKTAKEEQGATLVAKMEKLEARLEQEGMKFDVKRGVHIGGAFLSIDVPIETGSTVVVPSKAEGTGMEADGGKAAAGVENKSTERGRQATVAEPAASVKQTDGGDVPPEPYKGSQREARDKVAGSLALAAENDRLSYFDKHDAWKQTHMEADGKGHPDKTSTLDNYNPKLDDAAYRDQKGKLLTQREMGTLSAIAGEEVQKIQADPEAKSLSKGEIAERLKEGVMRRLQEIAEKKDGRDGLAEFRKESLDYASRLFDRPETREAVQSLQATANGPGSLRGAGVKEPTAGDKEVAAGASKDVEGELRQQAGAMAPPKFGFEAATNVQVPAGGGAMPSKGTVRMP